MALVGDPTTALVLGGGGVGGTAWLLGLASGLTSHGVGLLDADVIIGTSAGALAAVILAGGARDIDALGDDPRTPGTADAPPPDPGMQRETIRILGTPSMDGHEHVRRIAQLVADVASATDRQLDRIEALIGVSRWPDADLRIVSTDLTTTDRRVWTRADDIPVASVVAASHAFPGAFPPVALCRHRHVDGGLFSDINADVALNTDRVLVLRPLAGVVPDIRTHAESAVMTAGATLVIGPGPEGREFLDATVPPSTAWRTAFQRGSGQARDVAMRIRRWHHESR
ncbi:patatin-like phospholipase family protein [Williamsia sterculiae]|uniref:NTE family protein n=1 Tax=Williamsia sterculiae TaxID=1344003 RepID=A0A1N7FWK1_9NOCA|nr:patatin-like phospholipase family protein [Williamsia sterculiae]SIS04616.1 NTE family protein [Williamsia sterculiae]